MAVTSVLPVAADSKSPFLDDACRGEMTDFRAHEPPELPSHFFFPLHAHLSGLYNPCCVFLIFFVPFSFKEIKSRCDFITLVRAIHITLKLHELKKLNKVSRPAFKWWRHSFGVNRGSSVTGNLDTTTNKTIPTTACSGG